MKTLINLSLRQNAIFIPADKINPNTKEMADTTAGLVANLSKLGYTFSEKLLHALNSVTPTYKLEVQETLRTVTGVKKNWTPLVKDWEVPTDESFVDHLATFFANVFKMKRGTTMPCGHIIPENTFPLERYNGCPFCGTPFQVGTIEYMGQGCKLKVLELWTEVEVQAFFKNLLESKTALDATQVDSLKILLEHLEAPQVKIGMKETSMLLIDALIERGEAHKAQPFLRSPADILRYLWYKHTGFLQIIEPKTIIQRTAENNTYLFRLMHRSESARLEKKEELKLKYSRKECRMVAAWLNNLEMEAEKACEIMHPKRGIWVRMIRALRLAEYSKKPGYEKLARLMDVFYKQTYEVWMGKLETARFKFDPNRTFSLLKQRPGLFARSLFANMLWFGPDATINAFKEVVDQVPARLVFSLNSYATNYFDPAMERSVTPLGGTRKRIASNPLLELYTKAQRNDMRSSVEGLCIYTIQKRFAAVATESKTMYIDPMLFNIPLSIGERSTTIQDQPGALIGTRFPVEGDQVRLFMQWGEGLPAQHLDMDLSCHIAYHHSAQICSYSQLTTTGCQHSGDIQRIPHKVGTAEYININIPELEAAGAHYVTFTCNAYTLGSISPNLVIGWMNTKHRMKISRKSGVAYDPSCVQHQVRITQGLAKGLVFGVLDVATREIVWLEMAFGGQVVQGLDYLGVKALLAKLHSRQNIGALLKLKAEAQGLEIIGTTDADETYDLAWARDTAAVTQLLLD